MAAILTLGAPRTARIHATQSWQKLRLSLRCDDRVWPSIRRALGSRLPFSPVGSPCPGPLAPPFACASWHPYSPYQRAGAAKSIQTAISSSLARPMANLHRAALTRAPQPARRRACLCPTPATKKRPKDQAMRPAPRLAMIKSATAKRPTSTAVVRSARPVRPTNTAWPRRIVSRGCVEPGAAWRPPAPTRSATIKKPTSTAAAPPARAVGAARFAHSREIAARASATPVAAPPRPAIKTAIAPT